MNLLQKLRIGFLKTRYVTVKSFCNESLFILILIFKGRIFDKKYIKFIIETLIFISASLIIALWLPSFGTILGI